MVSKKIFLDCGAWTGNSIKKFRLLNDDADEYEIHAFEPYKPSYDLLCENYPEENIIKNRAALWDKSVIRTLRCSGDDKYSNSNSLLKGKRVKQYQKISNQRVVCIDFSQYILENFKLSDYIVCKFNIEGAEYRVLRQMFDDDTIRFINRWYIDWHWSKMNMTEENHSKIADRIPHEKWDNIL